MFKFQDDTRSCHHCPCFRSNFDIVDLQNIYRGKILFPQNRFFRSAKPTVCDSCSMRASRLPGAVSPGLTLRFHPYLTANELLTYVKYRLFFKVNFNMLCVNHVYQYLIRLPILVKKFVVTNILKTSGIQFAFPPVNRCQCTLKKKSSPGIRKKNWKAWSGAIN